MTHFETIWRFETARFTVTLDVAPEDQPDLSFDDTGETQDKVARGIWGVYLFRTRVLLDGREIGCDYLGHSIYENPSEFRDHIGARGKYGSYFTDMIHSAIGEARKAICEAPRVRCS